MDRAELTKRLKQARLEAGLKQEDLAKCLEIPISAVSILESGNRKLDVLELVKLADLYGKPIEWFFKVHDASKKRRWYDQNDDETAYAIKTLFTLPEQDFYNIIEGLSILEFLLFLYGLYPIPFVLLRLSHLYFLLLLKIHNLFLKFYYLQIHIH